MKSFDIRKDDIILLKTKNSYDPLEKFNRNFVYVAPSAVDYFMKKKIRTVGTDYLSVEKFGSEDHYTHKTLLGNGIVIIEGLRLGEIKAGKYKLTCLPLKIDADGAPARAILEDL